MARISASRSCRVSHGPPTTGSMAGAARGSTSTRTCRSAPRASSTRSPTRRIPGHHLEHAWKEADLVDEAGRLEASILLINTPECLISEGLADLGRRFAVPPDEETGLLVELYARAGLAVAGDPPPLARAAALTVRPGAASQGAIGDPRQRRHPAPRRRSVARRGAGLSPRSRAVWRRPPRRSASNSSNTRSGAPTSLSTPRAKRC